MSNNQDPEVMDDKSLPRIRLGPKAYEIAESVSGGEKVTAHHLEAAIFNLLKPKPSAEKIPLWVKDQLQLINETLISMRYMIQALSAGTSDEVEIMLEMMNNRINKTQLEAAEDSDLDHPALRKLQEKIEETQRRQSIEDQQSRKDQDIERE